LRGFGALFALEVGVLFEGGGAGFFGFLCLGFCYGGAFVGAAGWAYERGGCDGVAAVTAEVAALVFAVGKDADEEDDEAEDWVDE